MQDAETGQRGYLLTGEPRYLEPFLDAKMAVPARISEVRNLFRNDPSANATLAKIAQATDDKLSELSQTVELKKAGKSAEALAVVMTDRGKNIMDTLRQLIAEQSGVVEERLTEGIKEQQSNAVLARRFTLGAGLIILLAALGAVATILTYTKELVAARLEVEQLNTGLEQRVTERTAELQRANDEIQRFAYIVSHDLRSPLVNVMGYTAELEASLGELKSLAADPALDALASGAAARAAIAADMPESIGFIRSSTHKMDGLIKAILKLSREGQRVLRPEPVDLEELFSSAVTSVQHRVSEIGADIHILKPLPTITSDRLALEQIFGNLIDNALKYTVSGRAPTIAIRQAQSRFGTVVVEVQDNGRGISAEDQDRVFDLFRRAGMQDNPGEGIGLAHVRTLVRRLGGDITMESELGAGTTFRVALSRTLLEKSNEH